MEITHTFFHEHYFDFSRNLLYEWALHSVKRTIHLLPTLTGQDGLSAQVNSCFYIRDDN